MRFCKLVELTLTERERGEEILRLISKLYDVEREVNGKDPEEVKAARQNHPVPVLAVIEEKLRAWKRAVLPSSPFGQAITYATNQWKALNVYTTNGRLSIDNNHAERQMKHVVIGRKNYMFVGSDTGGERAAILYSLIATCKLNDVNPLEYLADASMRLRNGEDPESLTPQAWKAARASAPNSS